MQPLLPVQIVHRDAHLLVVSKPSGLPTTSPGKGPCLVDEVERLDPDAPRLHPTSRLDAEVTGLVTFARTREATRALLLAREEGSYRRLYVGIATGVPPVPSGCWDVAISIDPADPRRRVAGSGKGARDARSDYAVVSELEGASLLHLWPQTGRTHQLRVHCSHAGVPLFGDVHYGGPRRLVQPNGRVVTARRVMLHCTRLSLPRVGRPGEKLDVSLEVPADMQAAVKALTIQ